MAKAKQAPTKIAAATGTAGGGSNDLSGAGIEAAMNKAAEDAAKKGITDPDRIRDVKLAARKAYTEDARKAAAKAAKSSAK